MATHHKATLHSSTMVDIRFGIVIALLALIAGGAFVLFLHHVTFNDPARLMHETKQVPPGGPEPRAPVPAHAPGK